MKSESHWQFDFRPGGWVIATGQTDDSSVKRKKIAFIEKNGRVYFSIDGRCWNFQKSQIALKGIGSGKAAHSIESMPTAQFPGRVRKITVQEGDRVKRGDVLILVEAMKMEFSIKAPYDGMIAKIHITEGLQLMPGDSYLDLTPLDKEPEKISR